MGSLSDPHSNGWSRQCGLDELMIFPTAAHNATLGLRGLSNDPVGLPSSRLLPIAHRYSCPAPPRRGGSTPYRFPVAGARFHRARADRDLPAAVLGAAAFAQGVLQGLSSDDPVGFGPFPAQGRGRFRLTPMERSHHAYPLASINVGSLLLPTRFTFRDTGHICSMSSGAGLSNSVPATPVSHGSNCAGVTSTGIRS
jgi:hypothetical protein